MFWAQFLAIFIRYGRGASHPLSSRKNGSFVGMKTTSIVVALFAVACGGSHGKMRTDTPILAYQKPDISEITGVDEPEVNDEAPEPAPAAPAPPAPAAAPTPAAAPAPASKPSSGVAPAPAAAAAPTTQSSPASKTPASKAKALPKK